MDLKFDLRSGTHYPVGELNVETKLSEIYGINKDRIIATSGMTSLIHYVYQMFSGKNVILVEPLSSEHRRSAIISDCHITRIGLKSLLKHAEILHSFNFQLISLNLPVNPTGEIIKPMELQKILNMAEKKDAITFLDQAYMDFLNAKTKHMIQKVSYSYPSIIIARSMTKITVFPGIRLGFEISSKQKIVDLKKTRDPWDIPSYYEQFLDHMGNSKLNVNEVEMERKILEEGIKKLRLQIIRKSEVNFFSSTLGRKYNGNEFYKKMLDSSFLLRKLNNLYGFGEGDFRINVRMHEENIDLLKAIEVALHGKR